MRSLHNPATFGSAPPYHFPNCTYVKDACSFCMDDVIVFYRSILHKPGHAISCDDGHGMLILFLTNVSDLVIFYKICNNT